MKLLFLSFRRLLLCGSTILCVACPAPTVCGASEYLVSDRATNQILRYAAADGTWLGPLVDDNLATNGGLSAPSAMTIGFDGDLFVTSINLSTWDGEVLRYDTADGSFQGVFATGIHGPAGLLYHVPSESLLVGELGMGLGDSNVIARFDAAGTRLPDIVFGPVSGRTGMVLGADGRLFVSSFAEEPFFLGSVLEYQYTPDTDDFSYVGVFAAATELSGANGITFDAQGDMYVTSLLGQGVMKFDIDAGGVIGSTVAANVAYPAGLLVTRDDHLLVTSLGNNNPDDLIYPDLFPGAVFMFDPVDGSMIGDGPFMTGGEDFQPTALLYRPEPGDYDGDGVLTAADIDALTLAVNRGDTSSKYDLNDDQQVDKLDRTFWVEQRKRTYFGDADLDGEFNSGDMVAVFAKGEYEDALPGNSTWATGDWDGNGEFESGDMVLAFQTGGYEKGPRHEAVAVPEPGSLGLLWVAGFVLRWRRRPMRKR